MTKRKRVVVEWAEPSHRPLILCVSEQTIIIFIQVSSLSTRHNMQGKIAWQGYFALTITWCHWAATLAFKWEVHRCPPKFCLVVSGGCKGIPKRWETVQYLMTGWTKDKHGKPMWELRTAPGWGDQEVDNQNHKTSLLSFCWPNAHQLLRRGRVGGQFLCSAR
jgi:hypothetical protein